MATYNCKFQIYRENGLFSRHECNECSPDPINNPKCPSYAPIKIDHFKKLKGRVINAINKLEKDLK